MSEGLASHGLDDSEKVADAVLQLCRDYFGPSAGPFGAEQSRAQLRIVRDKIDDRLVQKLKALVIQIECPRWRAGLALPTSCPGSDLYGRWNSHPTDDSDVPDLSHQQPNI